MAHISVLQREAVELLALKPGAVVVDCTLGSGGHARELIKSIGPSGTFIGIDADPAAIVDNEALKSVGQEVHLVNANFRNVAEVVKSLGITKVDAILADLGWRMEQFEGSRGEPRGFSFNSDEPLTMTFGDPSSYAFTAADIVNEWREEDIANVIYAYGEERAARRLAAAIVAARQKKPIATAAELAELIAEHYPVPRHKQRIHPATKTFQALRIAVNDEFDALEELIQSGFPLLAPHGRLAIITFHSLEDRIVKHTFRSLAHDQAGVLVTKRPVTPTEEELQANPRARSAKLRVIEHT